MRLRDVDVVTVTVQPDGGRRRCTWHDGRLEIETWTPRQGCDGWKEWWYTVYSDRAYDATKAFINDLINHPTERAL